MLSRIPSSISSSSVFSDGNFFTSVFSVENSRQNSVVSVNTNCIHTAKITRRSERVYRDLFILRNGLCLRLSLLSILCHVREPCFGLFACCQLGFIQRLVQLFIFALQAFTIKAILSERENHWFTSSPSLRSFSFIACRLALSKALSNRRVFCSLTSCIACSSC